MEGRTIPHITPRGAFVYTGVKEPASTRQKLSTIRLNSSVQQLLGLTLFPKLILKACPPRLRLDWLITYFTHIFFLKKRVLRCETQVWTKVHCEAIWNFSIVSNRNYSNTITEADWNSTYSLC